MGVQLEQLVGVATLLFFVFCGICAGAYFLWRKWRKKQDREIRVSQALLEYTIKCVRRKSVDVLVDKHGDLRVADIDDEDGLLTVAWHTQGCYTEEKDRHVSINGRINLKAPSEPIFVGTDIFLSARFTLMYTEHKPQEKSVHESGMLISYMLKGEDGATEEVSGMYLGEKRLLELEHDELFVDIVRALELKTPNQSQ